MTRYNSRNSRNDRYRKNNRSSHFGLWMFTVILFVTFTIGLVYIGKHGGGAHKIKAAQQTLAAKTEMVAKTKKDESEVKRAKPEIDKQTSQTFEFYNILTQDKIEDNSVKASASVSTSSEDNANKTTTAAAAKNANPVSQPAKKEDANVVKGKPKNSLYVLEILKTKDFEVVDHAKAELALIGYEINITTVKNSNSNVYVVTIGPFNNKESAIANQKQLSKYNVRSIVKQMKG